MDVIAIAIAALAVLATWRSPDGGPADAGDVVIIRPQERAENDAETLAWSA